MLFLFEINAFKNKSFKENLLNENISLSMYLGPGLYLKTQLFVNAIYIRLYLDTL